MFEYDTYGTYLNKKIQTTHENDKWIHDILGGKQSKNEHDKILFSTDEFILLPTRQWYIKNNKKLNKLYMIAFVKNIKIETLRDLNKSHIQLLKNICSEALKFIETTFGINIETCRPYIHYYPSTWILHIHFNTNNDYNQSIHPIYYVDDIIHNLEMCANYYQTTLLICRKS